MRLLNTATYEFDVAEDDGFNVDRQYAILSHRWNGREIKFSDFQAGRQSPYYSDSPLRPDTPQANKIKKACEKAEELGFDWIWIDTCCINKNEQAEEREAIRSMFRWYKNSTVCIIHLNDVQQSTGFRRFDAQHNDRAPWSVWFSRGWTLQELLAPRDRESVYFYDRDWAFMTNTRGRADELQTITGIDKDYLTGKKALDDACVAHKLSWMSRRDTSRVEDMAYSMVGLFGVSLIPDYGEGNKAWFRLQTAIFHQCQDESLFAWRSESGALTNLHHTAWEQGLWGLLAPSPKCFKDCSHFTMKGRHRNRQHEGGFVWTQSGIRAPVPHKDFYKGSNMFIPWQLQRRLVFTLNCWAEVDGSQKALQIYLQKTKGKTFMRHRLDELGQTTTFPFVPKQPVQFVPLIHQPQLPDDFDFRRD